MTEAEKQPESIRTGWYWNGSYTIWVVGPSANGAKVLVLDRSEAAWIFADRCQHWQRVHEAVQESGKGFDWHPPVHNP